MTEFDTTEVETFSANYSSKLASRDSVPRRQFSATICDRHFPCEPLSPKRSTIKGKLFGVLAAGETVQSVGVPTNRGGYYEGR